MLVVHLHRQCASLFLFEVTKRKERKEKNKEMEAQLLILKINFWICVQDIGMSKKKK